jgi:hypothetical protein
MPGIPCMSRKGMLLSSNPVGYRTALTEMMMCGMLPSSAITFSLSIVSTLPTTSSRTAGRYFSTLLLTREAQLLCEESGTRWTDQGISYDSTSIFLDEIWFSRAAPDIVADPACPGVFILGRYEFRSASRVVPPRDLVQK